MQTIELFSGQKSFSTCAALFGLKTFTVDHDLVSSPDLCIDINILTPAMLPDNIKIVWASPDCTAFSIASGNKYFRTVEKSYRKYNLIPLNSFARSAIKLIEKTISLISEINPDFYYIENPRGLLNHLPIMKEIPFKTSVYYADYNAPSMKPTDIWHNNFAWISKIPKHKYSYKGLPHLMDIANKHNRSVVPYQLINEILYYTLLNYETTEIHL